MYVCFLFFSKRTNARSFDSWRIQKNSWNSKLAVITRVKMPAVKQQHMVKESYENRRNSNSTMLELNRGTVVSEPPSSMSTFLSQKRNFAIDVACRSFSCSRCRILDIPPPLPLTRRNASERPEVIHVQCNSCGPSIWSRLVLMHRM